MLRKLSILLIAALLLLTVACNSKSSTSTNAGASTGASAVATAAPGTWEKPGFKVMHIQGVDQRSKYPKGADPIVLGESVNTITSYGYDPVTGMHEGKVTLCQIQAA